MMIQHSNLANGAWQELTFFEQMANTGSEVFRAINWQEKKNHKYSDLAFERALELLSLTIDDPKNKHGLKELTRLYEFLVDFFAGENEYHSKKENFEKYFYAFTYAARNAREVST